MKMLARKAAKGTLSSREQLQSAHLRAAPLRNLFPQVEQLRIELTFHDPSSHLPPPSSQLHTLFAGAPGFFRFPCPCADCDGAFDLTEAVAGLIPTRAGFKRTASVKGNLPCHGVRFRENAALHGSCPIQLSFCLLAEPY